ncbi:MAG: hypothetical protein R2754_16580 [Microthrixaceae bacterium]
MSDAGVRRPAPIGAAWWFVPFLVLGTLAAILPMAEFTGTSLGDRGVVGIGSWALIFPIIAAAGLVLALLGLPAGIGFARGAIAVQALLFVIPGIVALSRGSNETYELGPGLVCAVVAGVAGLAASLGTSGKVGDVGTGGTTVAQIAFGAAVVWWLAIVFGMVRAATTFGGLEASTLVVPLYLVPLAVPFYVAATQPSDVASSSATVISGLAFLVGAMPVAVYPVSFFLGIQYLAAGVALVGSIMNTLATTRRYVRVGDRQPEYSQVGSGEAAKIVGLALVGLVVVGLLFLVTAALLR